MMKTRLYLITGFLGSGKTTLLSRMLSTPEAGRVGVIVNDFGKLGCDSEILRTFETKGVLIKELVNGQIFCSCLSPSFIQSVAAFKDLGLDRLIVEASGLAKPSSLYEILAGIDRVTDGAFEYQGMICIVDASRYLQLSRNVNAIDEQILFSDAVLINKVDLVSDEVVSAVERSIKDINPDAVMVRSSYCLLNGDVIQETERLLETRKQSRCPACEAYSLETVPQQAAFAAGSYAGWGVSGRPVPYTIIPESLVAMDRLRAFLSEIAPKTYRMKGYLKTDEGLCYIDGIGESVIVSPQQDGEVKTLGLTIISRIGKSLGTMLHERWNALVGEPSWQLY